MGRAKKNVEVEAQVIATGNVVPMMTETESEETVQYVSDEDAAREDRLVSEIRMITEQTKQVVLFNSIEIGRRLTEAKAMVKRGTWGTWLKERVDYSQRTANNFMKIYQEYGRNGLAEKSQALANLSYTQALALIDLPEDERARFAEERKAGEMALRKLQEEVRQLYILGDFSFKMTAQDAYALRKRIACRRIHLIPGNHDKDWTQPAVAGAFTVEPPICVLKIDGQKIVLSHYPMADWQGMGHGSWHLHGHIHSGGGAYNEFNRKQGLLRYDVGCDANGHSPVSLDELREWFAGVDEPCDRVKWPWWVNETGDRQVERELAAYKRKEQS